MLKSLRERTKTILWIVVLAFVISIFALWGMDLRAPNRASKTLDAVGLIDGEKVSYQTYQNALNELWAQIKEQRGQDYEPSDIERNALADQAWENIIRNYLLSNEINKLKIAVTDEQLVSFLRSNPHPQLVKVFTDEQGRFDYAAYLKALSDPKYDWIELERWARSVIPQLTLETYLISKIHIPESEAMRLFEERNSTMKAQYVEIAFEESDRSYEPTDQELRALYEKNIEEYTIPAMRKIRLIEIDKLPSAEDEEEALQRLSEIRRDIIDGRIDFDSAAVEYSEDKASASKGGDLGFIGKGDMVSDFEKVAFSLKPGDISEPFKTQFGYHIVKVTERKIEKGAEKVCARHILIKPEPGYNTLDSISTLVKDITASIKKDGFEETAAKMNLSIKDVEPFQNGMFIKDVGFVPRLVNFAFNNKVGSVSFPVETSSKVYFARIVEEIPESARPFEEMRDRLVQEIRRNRSEEKARAKALEVRRTMIERGFLSGAKEHGLVVQTTPPFKLSDQIPGIGANTAFATACKFLEIGSVSPPVKVGNEYFIISLLERSKPDPGEYAKARMSILSELRNEAASRFIANWYQELREKAKIEDLRERALR